MVKSGSYVSFYAKIIFLGKLKCMRFSIASKEMHYTKFGKTPRVQKTTEFQILDKATEWDGQNEKYRISKSYCQHRNHISDYKIKLMIVFENYFQSKVFNKLWSNFKFISILKLHTEFSATKKTLKFIFNILIQNLMYLWFSNLCRLT